MVSEQRRGVLITGGMGGLGGPVTRAFVEAGYRVATTYTSQEKWQSLGELKDKVLASRPTSWMLGQPRGGRTRSLEGSTPS